MRFAILYKWPLSGMKVTTGTAVASRSFDPNDKTNYDAARALASDHKDIIDRTHSRTCHVAILEDGICIDKIQFAIGVNL